MAGNLQSSYGANNIEITQDYSYSFNQIDVGEPVVTMTRDLSGETDVKYAAWKRAVMVETAGWKYIGMDYATAKSCANAMRSALTFTTYPWEYGYYMTPQTSALQFGWHKSSYVPTLESDVAVRQRSGCMYDVVVNARATTENYSLGSVALDIGSRPLADQLQSIAGWNSSVSLTGEHFDAAGSGNIRVVSAPTNKVSFELVGQKLITSNPSSPTGLSLDDWYRATTDQYAQVRYEGMTKSACRSLFSSLNSTGGWYLQYHPWVYDVTWN
jgi:hypothetical protein